METNDEPAQGEPVLSCRDVLVRRSRKRQRSVVEDARHSSREEDLHRIAIPLVVLRLRDGVERCFRRSERIEHVARMALGSSSPRLDTRTRRSHWPSMLSKRRASLATSSGTTGYH